MSRFVNEIAACEPELTPAEDLPIGGHVPGAAFAMTWL